MKAIGLTFVFFAIIGASEITYGSVAAPSRSRAMIQAQQQVLEFPTVDRSRKGDRLRSSEVATAKNKLPPGCEPPFSPLAKLSLPNLKARCVT
jgi:hypothetical protein